MSEMIENNEMNLRNEAAMEAVLFTMGASVEESVLADALGISEEEVERTAARLSAKYEGEDRGIRLIRLESAYQLVTKTNFYEVLVRIASKPVKPVLTDVMMEVLSVIAYKQPVTRGEIEKVRGVSSDYAVNRLVEFGLVEEKGRQESPGRPILFGTTEEFLRRFGLTSTTELPPIDEDLIRRLALFEEGGEEAMSGQISFPISPDGRVIEEGEEGPKPGDTPENPITVEI